MTNEFKIIQLFTQDFTKASADLNKCVEEFLKDTGNNDRLNDLCDCVETLSLDLPMCFTNFQKYLDLQFEKDETYSHPTGCTGPTENPHLEQTPQLTATCSYVFTRGKKAGERCTSKKLLNGLCKKHTSPK